MGKITINELHKSLFGYVQAVSDESLETKDKTIVGAINELIQNSDSNKISNGKQLIANAIGEPLTAEDSFNEMSNDINSLLSTFKTNMMNNGVAVESGDKFKQLIDKIKGLTEGEGNKGIQYAEGVSAKHLINNNPNAPETISVKMVGGSNSSYPYITIDNLNFTPSIVIAMGESPGSVNTTNPAISVLSYDYFSNTQTVKISNYSTSTTSSTTSNIIANDSIIFDNMIKLPIFNGNISTYHWYAIGVGEKDTTLNSGLNIISATTLPATGKENQICVITDNPDNKIVFVTNLNDIDHSTNNIYIYLGTSEANAYNTGKTYECDSGNFTFKLYIVKIYQKSKNLASYIYQNGTWVEYTYDYVYFIENSALTNSEIFGTLVSGNAMVETSTAVYICSPKDSGGYPYHVATTNKKIDFSLYNYIEVVGYHESDSGSITMMCYDSTRNGHYGSYISPMHYANPVGRFTTTSSVVTYDISSWTSTGYLGFSYTTQSGNQYIYITDVRLR